MDLSENWDWKEIAQVSSKLNRYIKKLSASKINGHPILPVAENEMKNGSKFL